MDKRVCFAVLFLLVLTLFAACAAPGPLVEPIEPIPMAFVADGEPQPPATFDATGDDIPISRGLVAKMIALTFSDIYDINHAARIINFTDTNAGLWYDRFINTAVSLDHLSGSGANFYPESPLTLEQAQLILDRLDPANPIRIQLTPQNRHLAISYALWVNLYMQMLENISGDATIADHFGIVQEEIVVLITPQFNPLLPQGHIVTNMGHMTTSGLCFAGHLDQELTILRRDNDVVAILGIANPTPTLHNVYVMGRSADTITIFSGGAQRTYKFDGSNLPPGRIADIHINGRRAEMIQPFDQVAAGVIKEVTDIAIEIENIGHLPLRPSFAVYSMLYDHITLGNVNQLTIGYDVAEFVLRDGQIAAAVVLRRPTPEHIRVVLSTTGFAGRLHPTVELRSDTGLTIQTYDDTIEIPPGEIFRLTPLENTHLMTNGRITITPNDSGKTEIVSISRNWPNGAHPQYRGIIEISNRPGGFVIVNQLPLEEYLYAVIPSEMPASFGPEAAKVQAVTARSYAYNQFFANRFYMYGANVDDSVMSQVYNNFPETQTAITAVHETRGIYLTHNGSVISANFFSTSAGHTANSGDVWINSVTQEFDNPTPPYLTAQPQYLSGNFGDLSTEANARAFFTDTAIESHDNNSPWFRWHMELSNAELTEIIAANLPRLAAASPNLFLVPDGDTFPPQFVTVIGDFRAMEVVSRGQGGNIRELLITGTTASVLVRTEYAIRQLLTPRTTGGIILHRHNATPITNHFILPSTFMTFAATDGSMIFHGGGFGHGVGMSQHGVYGM
ncbi:MAG: SpoIID/LytB domain-containing protein, partial [Defluviitaleaceae bacterium]|nr:SpoIID/LytB domain-containing protein [Defluviitaleaceae bacterium]